MSAASSSLGPDGAAALRELRSFRAGMYAFLSGVFGSPPSEETLETLRDGAFLESVRELFGATIAGELEDLMRDVDDLASLRSELEQEFVNLFEVPGGQYVTPYESVFRDAREIAGQEMKGLLMGESAIDVQQWYKLARFDISPDYQELPDHVSLELRYLAEVCRKEKELEEGGDLPRLRRAWEMERDFLAAHLVPWIGDLARKIQEKAGHPYYPTHARLAVVCLQRDLATLEEFLGPSSGRPRPRYGEVGEDPALR